MVYDLKSLCPPLKKEIPLFHYDVAMYCKAFIRDTFGLWPKYLTGYKQKVHDYAKQLKLVKPAPHQIANECRIYIFDNRLNLMFAVVDTTGEIATYCSKFIAQYDKHNSESYIYGDQSKIGATYPCKIKGQIAEIYNEAEMLEFNKRYGFLPIESFASPSIAIFERGTLAQVRTITTLQSVLLMEKFHTKNLVDYKAILSQIVLSDVWVL